MSGPYNNRWRKHRPGGKKPDYTRSAFGNNIGQAEAELKARIDAELKRRAGSEGRYRFKDRYQHEYGYRDPNPPAVECIPADRKRVVPEDRIFFQIKGSAIRIEQREYDETYVISFRGQTLEVPCSRNDKPIEQIAQAFAYQVARWKSIRRYQ